MCQPKFNHATHFGLTIISLGLWLPMWAICWAIYNARNAHKHEWLFTEHPPYMAYCRYCPATKTRGVFIVRR